MSQLAVYPLTPDRWPDLERLFGPSGAYSGCWCMWPRLSSAEFSANGNAGNKKGFRQVVRSGSEPGLLAFRGDEPVGWVAVAPREEYGRVLRSPLHKPFDTAEEVWSITCFFIAKPERRSGVAMALLEAAVEFARARGAAVIEGYPVNEKKSDADMWQGSVQMFERSGFAVAVERKPGRPVMRCYT